MSTPPNPLDAAKAALKNASNFGQRDTGNKKVGDPTPPHRTSSAPITYHAAHPDNVPTVNDELKAKADNVNQYVKASQQ
jgi:hypothetical protein